MLSVANVRSAGGAASDFAKDNYYASADADRSGLWARQGSRAPRSDWHRRAPRLRGDPARRASCGRADRA
jgi:hypothetical protein